MHPQDVARVLNDPLAQELVQSSIPARLAYVGPDGFPRAIPIGFHWNGAQFVLCTVPHAPKVSALKANPKVALTVGTNAFPPHVWRSSRIPRGIQKERRTRPVGCFRGAGARHVQADGPHQDRAALGQAAGLSDAISNSDREVAPPGELTNWSCRLAREELPGLRQIARVSTFGEPVVQPTHDHRGNSKHEAPGTSSVPGA